MVKTLPFSDLQVPVPGFGAMGISFGLGSNLTLEQAEPVLLKAIELGCTFWDTAVSEGSSLSSKIEYRLIRNIKGCLPGRRQRKSPWRFHQEAQCPRQGFQCVESCSCFGEPIMLNPIPNSCFEMRLRLFRRRQGHEFCLSYQAVHRRHHLATRLRSRSLLSASDRP